MTPDELDRVLASNDPLVPSSGFAMSVMDAVRQQASEPPPLRFPWLRFVTGLLACIAMAWIGNEMLVRLEVSYSPIAERLALILVGLGSAAAAAILGVLVAALPRLMDQS